MKILLFLTIMLMFWLTQFVILYAKTIVLTAIPTIDYSFTRNNLLSYTDSKFTIGKTNIKPIVSINNIEKDLSQVNNFPIIKNNKYNWEFGFELESLDNVNFIAFDMTNLRRYDDISFTDGRIRIIFEDMIDKGDLSIINDSRIILRNPTSTVIDPIIELLGNSTNKFYVSGITATERTPSYATTEFTQTNYNQTNRSENIRYTTSVTPLINGLPRWRYNRFTFNVSGYSNIVSIKYCIEGYYTNLEATGGQNAYYYNVTSGSWVYDIPLSLNVDTESTKCKIFNVTTELIDATSNLIQFGSDISASDTVPTNIYIDFINVTLNISEPITTTTTTTTTTLTTTTTTTLTTTTTTTLTTTTTISISAKYDLYQLLIYYDQLDFELSAKYNNIYFNDLIDYIKRLFSWR